MPANYADAQGRVYDWRTGRPISGQSGVGSIPSSRVPPAGRATSSRAPAGGVAPRRAAPSVGAQRQRLSDAWGGTVTTRTNNQGFGIGGNYQRMRSTPMYLGTGNVLYDAATGMPLSGSQGVGSIPPSAGASGAPRSGRSPRPQGSPARFAGGSRLQAPSARAPIPAARPAAAPAARPGAPGMGSTRIEVPASRRRAAALNVAAQQGGLPTRYDAMGPDVRLAASERSRQIGEARAAGQEIPVNLTPASEAWWNDADNAAWARSNKTLANRLRQKHGLPGLDASGEAPFAVSSTTGAQLRQSGPTTAGYTMASPLLPEGTRKGMSTGSGYRVDGLDQDGMPLGDLYQSNDNWTQQALQSAPAPMAEAPQGAMGAEDLNNLYLRKIRGMETFSGAGGGGFSMQGLNSPLRGSWGASRS